MTHIRLIYVDDTLDTALSEYLAEYAERDLRELDDMKDVELHYAEVEYDPNQGFRSLLRNTSVQNANIILMDSKLFETSTPPKGMLSGETFRVLLRKYYPFIEVIVITQNENRNTPGMGMVYKHYWRKDGKVSDYYKKELVPHIADAIHSIETYRLQFRRLEEELNDPAVLDKVSNSLEGLDLYDELSKADIDELVGMFKRLSEAIEHDAVG